ncbi:MAG TPA: GTP-binding protein [Cyclobacteriaceae bacterium]|nr:GTP-binding protein [Cyclobacteriaceae bacterium]
MMETFTIGITGGSGSGKTRFIKSLATHFTSDELCLVSMDHYYRPLDQQLLDKKGVENFDLPQSIDCHALRDDIIKLKQGKLVIKEEYTFNNPEAKPIQLTFKPAPILLIEGLFVQYFEEIEQELDLRIFIEAKDHIKLGRRIRRDREERGYDVDDVLYRYEHHTMPVYDELIEPLKHNADLIIPNNNDFKAAVDVLVSFIKLKISGIAN